TWPMSELIGLRDDVYRRPLATALERLGLGSGWTCVDVGAGGGDVSVALAGEDLVLPEQVDLAFCRFLLLHVLDPAVVVRRMASVVRPGAWVVAQEPITSAGRVGGRGMSMPDAPHP